MHHVDIVRIGAEKARPLRHTILRPRQPISGSVYPLDHMPETFHVGAYEDGKLVGVASAFHENPPEVKNPGAWRLRGVVTQPEVRGRGYGARLVLRSIAYISREGGSMVWLRARANVVGFFERLGFRVQGKADELPGQGLHYMMVRPVDPDDAYLSDTY
jgi:ribosomal protein S18 acetylase RimI-like enzyme